MSDMMKCHRIVSPSRAGGALLLCVALLASAVWCRADADDAPAAPAAKDSSPAAEVTQVTLTPEAVKRYGIALGTARKQKLAGHVVAPAEVAFNAQATAVVGCPVQGRVTAVRANVGDVVKAGDELLVVQSPELGEAQSDYLQKRAALAAAEAAVEPAKAAYDRAKSLYQGSQGITLGEMQKREVEYTAAKNAVLIAQAADKAAESKLRLFGMNKAAIDQLPRSGEINPAFSVRAPIAGTVTERLVTLGELVKPDRERLLVVADLTTLWVLADVPESRLASVRKGAKASVAVGDQTIDGAVDQVGVSVDPATRTAPVRIEVKGGPGLKPGMFAQVDITTGRNDDPVVTAPGSAIQMVDGSTAVFLPVKGRPDTFERRMVSVGDAAADGQVSIVSGLDAGERVVTSGAFILKAELAKASAKDND